MSNKIQSIRGMHDILPDASAAWQLLEIHLQQLMDAYGYHEIRMPLVEKTELFARSIGDVTDIVEKEMYSFTDRNGENLSLRPEGTAGCVRAALEHGLLHNQVQRLWYTGPMFRHERPQKGRYRQFHQLGVEAFGMTGAGVEAELILMGARLWRLLDLSDIHLEINSLGTVDERAAYREALQRYLQQHQSDLDADSQRRLYSNPLRILDSKSSQTQAVLNTAPILSDYLGSTSQAHFSDLRAYLEAAKIDYRVNPRLVRGLDYYSHTVFEWVTQSLGAQGTICAGGRYDGLVQQLGGRPSPAVGFAMGLERVLALLEQSDTWRPAYGPDLYIAFASESFAPAAMLLAESLRDELPELGIMCHCGAGGLKAQLRQADRSGAEYVLILGEDEIQNNTVSLKSLRSEDAQQNITRAALSERVAFLFNLETR